MKCPNCNVNVLDDSVIACPNCNSNLFGLSSEPNNINYSGIHDKYVWMLAFAPLLLIMFGTLMAFAEIDAPGSSISTIVYIILMIMDRNMLKENGIKLSVGWIIAGAVIPPAYLFARSSEAKRSYAPAIVSTVLFTLFILIFVVLFTLF